MVSSTMSFDKKFISGTSAENIFLDCPFQLSWKKTTVGCFKTPNFIKQFDT